MTPSPVAESMVEPSPEVSTSRPGRAVTAIVHRISAAIASGAISAGDTAELRRLKAEDPAAPAFWKVLAAYVAPNWSFPKAGPALDDTERRWAVILNALAYLPGLDEPRRNLGGALAEAGFSELRLVRLLRASDERLADSIRKAAHYLASKAEPANLADLADLVLSEGRDWSEGVRRRIARAYYQAAPKP